MFLKVLYSCSDSMSIRMIHSSQKNVVLNMTYLSDMSDETKIPHYLWPARSTYLFLVNFFVSSMYNRYYAKKS